MLNLSEAGLPLGVCKELAAVLHTLAAQSIEALACGLGKRRLAIVGQGGEGQHLDTVLLQLLLQAYVGRLAVIVEYHEQCQQRKCKGDDDSSTQEHETDVALAQDPHEG